MIKNEDSLSSYQPRGKQGWVDETSDCWYVQTTEIWQMVWLRLLNEVSLDSVKINPDINTESVTFEFKFPEEVN